MGLQNSAYRLASEVFFRIEKMQKTRWKFGERVPHEDALALADSLNISVVLAELLIQRGVTNFLESKNFFRPTLEDLHDPFLMDGMEEASIRTIEAITCNQKIVVYGDYDVDGTCASSLMYMFLKNLGADVEIYIPNRLSEGYGISRDGIDFAKEHNTQLIISVDCGITAVDEVDYANSLGIDTIICDHHQPKEKLPEAYAILDPLKPGDTYPFKYLAGAGVAFKLARAIGDRVGKKELAMNYVDLVALASAADIVPLTDENRILVRAGLDMINDNPRPGIAALLQIARMTHGNLSSGQIVFTIAPRINAVGRLGDAMRAVALFTSEDHDEAREIASVLESENLERRKIDEVTFSYALDMIKDKVDFERDKAIILHGDDWHPGVIGIVASRLVEKYHLPSIMLTTIDGVAKGSARSIQGFDIYQALEQCKDLLVQFGGHKAAAGLEIEVDKIDEFRRRFNEVLNTQLSENDIIPEIEIDAEINFSEITAKFIRILDQFAPFGPGNHRPVFLARNVRWANNPRIVGKNHIIGMLKQENSDKVFDAIGFNLGGIMNEIVDKNKILMDIVFTIDKFYKWDKAFPQLKLKDIRIKED